MEKSKIMVLGRERVAACVVFGKMVEVMKAVSFFQICFPYRMVSQCGVETRVGKDMKASGAKKKMCSGGSVSSDLKSKFFERK